MRTELHMEEPQYRRRHALLSHDGLSFAVMTGISVGDITSEASKEMGGDNWTKHERGLGETWGINLRE
jgi:hypothetical protein